MKCIHFLQLTFEASIASNGYSDIAIDDVYIDPGLCSKHIMHVYL